MKLPQIPLHDLEGATLNFEALQLRDILDQTGESVLQLLSTGTKRQVAFGQATMNFPSSVNATDLTVTHGLGRSPVVAVAFQMQGASSGQLITYPVSAVTTTTMTIQGRSSVSVNGNVTLGWLAIG